MMDELVKLRIAELSEAIRTATIEAHEDVQRIRARSMEAERKVFDSLYHTIEPIRRERDQMLKFLCDTESLKPVTITIKDTQ